jgi:hypothetical protein
MGSRNFKWLSVVLLAALALGAGCNTREVTYTDPCAAGPKGGTVWGCWAGQPHDTVTIDVPAGAVSEVVQFTVVPYEGPAPAGVVPGTAFTIVTDPPVEFALPIRLTIRFDPTSRLLPRPGEPGQPGHTEWLRLVQFEADGTGLAPTWRSTVDETAGLVRGETSHLSNYAIVDLKVAQATQAVASPPQSKVDVLFMIDNSNSMEPKQASLMQFFPKFMERLQAMEPPLDMHIGIVTSDLGAGQFTPPSCDTAGGDKGVLQNSPRGASCIVAQLDDPNDRFLRYADNGATANFTGTIEDAFSCYAAVGIGGCGFEHQLASVRAAFDTAFDPCHQGTNCTAELNAGFLRPDAALALVLLSDEDDCSAPSNSTLFDPTQTTLTSELGPLTSYRCFQFGSLCDGADPGRDPGSKLNCEVGTFQPNKPEHQLSPVEEFAAFFKGLKADPRMVSVSVLSGPPGPVVVGTDANGYPDLEPACTGAMGFADPALRLHKLTTLFDGDRTQFTSLCADDLAPAMDQVGTLVNNASVVAWCLDFAPVDFDPAPGLQVDCRANAADAGDLERCDVASLDASCFVVREATGCAGGAMLQLYRGTGLTDFGYTVSLECASVGPR